MTGLRCVCGALIEDGEEDLLAAVERHLRESHSARLEKELPVEDGDNVAQLDDEAPSGASYGARKVNRTGGRP